MSYVQIEIGGRARGLKFNQMAMEIMYQHYVEDSTAGNVYAMVYAGLRGNSYVKSEQPDYTLEQVCDWVDEISVKDPGLIKQVEDAMTSTEIFKELIKKGEENKKKVKKK